MDPEPPKDSGPPMDTDPSRDPDAEMEPESLGIIGFPSDPDPAAPTETETPAPRASGEREPSADTEISGIISAPSKLSTSMVPSALKVSPFARDPVDSEPSDNSSLC
jgi:hypothetical protein